MVSTQGETETASKDTNADAKKGGESLKVYIRVRPRLKTEFLKEAAAFVDPDVIFSEHRIGKRN